VTCHNCRIDCRKFGKRGYRQRYQCSQCCKVFTDARDNMLEGMYLAVETAERVLHMLLEGSSVSTVERLTNIHHTTILKLLLIAGDKCERILGTTLTNVPVRDVQADEIWSFVEKRKAPSDLVTIPRGRLLHLYCDGDAFQAVPNIAIGRRDQGTTNVFIEGLRIATSGHLSVRELLEAA
jgi:transposase-like protein